MVYSDHYTMVLDEDKTAKFQASLGEDASELEKSLRVPKLEKHPVIDYQQGSLRDDFDFGSLWLIKAQALRDYVAQARSSGISLCRSLRPETLSESSGRNLPYQ